jgi:hypothetical protein
MKKRQRKQAYEARMLVEQFHPEPDTSGSPSYAAAKPEVDEYSK